MHDQQLATDRGPDLLAAICERPDDDGPRLALADFLEHTGDADRARLIRLQCRLARMPWGAPDRGEVERETAALLGKHYEDWSAPVRPWALGRGWYRGFLAGIETRWDIFRAYAGPLFQSAPLLEVIRLTGLEPGLGDLTRVCASWRCAGPDGPREPDEVPAELWPLMQGRLADGGLTRVYVDAEGDGEMCRALALKDVSDAAVAYGRRAAGAFPGHERTRV
jgi:uncharacterized protein (TIGR02996 family)